MYTEFFGLEKLPFNLTPDPAFLFLPTNTERRWQVWSTRYGAEGVCGSDRRRRHREDDPA